MESWCYYIVLYSSTPSLKILESSQIPTEHFTILGQWECSIKDKEQDVGTRWYGHGRAKAAFKQEKENQRLLTERCSGISCQKKKNTFGPLRASIWVKNWQKGKNKDPNFWRERERRQPLKVSDRWDRHSLVNLGTRNQDQLHGHWPMQPQRTPLGLMLCCHSLEILHSFWIRNSSFSFCIEPTNYEPIFQGIFEGIPLSHM